MKSAHGTICAGSFSVDIVVRSFSDCQVSRICMVQIVNGELCLLGKELGVILKNGLITYRTWRVTATWRGG